MLERRSCFIRMSMNNLKDIHNMWRVQRKPSKVVLSGCQWTIWRIYTTRNLRALLRARLFYQDVNEQFEGYTQLALAIPKPPSRCFIRMSMNNLKDIHNCVPRSPCVPLVVLSGCQWTIWRIYTTSPWSIAPNPCCFIRMSMNNLKDIHNVLCYWVAYIQLFYQDFNEQFCCKSTKNPWNLQIYWKIFWYFRKKYYLCTNKFEGYTQ